MRISQTRGYKQRANIYKAANILISGKPLHSSVDYTTKKLAKLASEAELRIEDYNNHYTKNNYLSEDIIMPYNTDIDLTLKYMINETIPGEQKVTVNTADLIKAENKEMITTNTVYTYNLQVLDDSFKKHNIPYSLPISKPKFNQIFLSSEVIDLYYGSSVTINLFNRKNILGHTNNSISYHACSYIKTAKYSTDNYVINQYGIDLNKQIKPKKPQEYGFYGIDAAILNSTYSYKVSNYNTFVGQACTFNGTTMRFGREGTYIVVPKVTLSSDGKTANKDDIKKLFKLDKIKKSKTNKKTLDEYIDYRIDKLISRGIISLNTDNTYLYNTKNIHNFKNGCISYIDSTYSTYIGPFKLNKLQDVHDFYDKNSYGYLAMEIVPYVNSINTYTLNFVSSDDHSRMHQQVKKCAIHTHTLDTGIDILSNTVYSYYINKSNFSTLDISQNYVSYYKIDYDNYSYINTYNTNWKITRYSNSGLSNKINLPYTYITYNGGGVTGSTYGMNNLFTIKINPISYTNRNVTQIDTYTYINNEYKKLVTVYTVPHQAPKFTYTSQLDMSYAVNEISYNFNKIGYITIKYVDSEESVKYNAPIYNITTYGTTKHINSISDDVKINIAYTNCNFYNGPQTLTKGIIYDMPIITNTYIGVRYDTNTNYFNELTTEDFEPCTNSYLINCCAYAAMDNKKAEKYVIWEKNIDNSSTYLTAGSYIYFGRNNSEITETTSGSERTKPIYYLQKGATKAKTLKLTMPGGTSTSKTGSIKNIINVNYSIYEDPNSSVLKMSYYIINNGKRYELLTKDIINFALTNPYNTNYTVSINDLTYYGLTFKTIKNIDNSYSLLGCLFDKTLSSHADPKTDECCFNVQISQPFDKKYKLIKNFNYINTKNAVENYILDSTNDSLKATKLYLLSNNYYDCFNVDRCNPSYRAQTTDYTSYTVSISEDAHKMQYGLFTYTYAVDKLNHNSTEYKLMDISAAMYKSAYYYIDDLINIANNKYIEHIKDAYNNKSTYSATWKEENTTYNLYLNADYCITSSIDNCHPIVISDKDICYTGINGLVNFISCCKDKFNGSNKGLYLRTTLTSNGAFMFNTKDTCLLSGDTNNTINVACDLDASCNPNIIALDPYGIAFK